MRTPPPRSRRAARRRALEILYEADLKGRPLPAVLADHLAEQGGELGDFTLSIVRGVHRHREELDALIEANARGWKLSRMPLVDRNLLRMGLYEILHEPDVPSAVAINEAVDLAKELSTEDSGRFINGLLATVADQHSAKGA